MSEPLFKLIYGRDLDPDDWDEGSLVFPETHLHPTRIAKLPEKWLRQERVCGIGATLEIVTHSDIILLAFQRLVGLGLILPQEIEVEAEGETFGLKKNGDLIWPDGLDNEQVSAICPAMQWCDARLGLLL